MYFGELRELSELENDVIEIDVTFEDYEQLREQGEEVVERKEFTPYRSKVRLFLSPVFLSVEIFLLLFPLF